MARPHPRASRQASGHRRPIALAATSPRVRLPELVVGVLLVAGSALAALVWHSSSSRTTPALVLANPVERGHVFTESDFAAAEVRTEGVRLVPYADRSPFVGRVAAIDLTIAAPITADVAVDVLPVDLGEAIVGRWLKGGEYPLGLSPGATVRVVLVEDGPLIAASSGDPDEAGGPGTPPNAADESIVAAIEDVTLDETSPNSAIVTLRLPDSAADRVVAASGVRLVQIGDRS